MRSNRVWLNALALCRRGSLPNGGFRLICFSGLIAACLAAPIAHAQQAAIPAEVTTFAAAPQVEEPVSSSQMTAPRLDLIAESNAADSTSAMPGTGSLPATDMAAESSQPRKGSWFNLPGESEVIIEGLVSYGNYKIFASGYDEKLFTAGVEYDRHSWGYLLKAQMDYVGEVLPFMLLDKPRYTDIWGNPIPLKDKGIREYVPGVGISPIGFRLQWRSKKAIKPYLEAKGGVVVFAKKVPSSQATYENFTLQSGTGVQVKMSDRWGLRLGLFSDFHFSDAFIVPVNPGLDVMNANLGLSYHF